MTENQVYNGILLQFRTGYLYVLECVFLAPLKRYRVFEMNTHLEIIEDASMQLSKFGTAKVVYITSELQPFSNQQKPDLFFVNSLTGSALFVEYQQLRGNRIGDSYLKSLEDRMQFVKEDISNRDAIYLLAVDHELSREEKEYINSYNIIVLDNINSGQALADHILAIS